MTPEQHAPHSEHNHSRRWLILALLGLAQLMVVLDATIVNIALPSSQADLGFSDGNRQWIVTAYALAFGSLLLLGGRLGDMVGRRRIFVVGLLGFAAASALGGAAQSFGVLVGARGLQGAFGALLAPSALGLLTVTFTDPKERSKAFGIFGAIAGGGAAVGLLLGGVLTEYLSWRWCLYVNLLFAIPVAAGALALLDPARAPGAPRLDIPGVITASLGLFGLVFGFSRAESDGWGDPLTLFSLGAALVLLVLFTVIQRRVKSPLLPPPIVTDRARGGAFVALALSSAGIYAVFLFLTFFLQGTLDMSPVTTGLAFLPMPVTIVTTATTTGVLLLPRFGPRPLIPTAMLLIAAAMVYLAQLEATSHYVTGALPGMVIAGMGMGMIFAAGLQTATSGVPSHDAGVASATANTMQQVGAAVGTALLSTFAASATKDFLAGHAAGPPQPALIEAAQVHGYTTGFWIAAGIFAGGALITALLLPSGTPAQHAESRLASAVAG